MKISHKDALNILGLESSATQEEIKIAYRKACMQYHPDRNVSGLEMMKLVNNAYEALQDYVTGSVTEESNTEYGDDINTALGAIINLGLTIEVCGSWIWVSGNTHPHREILKENGFKWASKKKMWHYRPNDYKSFNRGTWSMDRIRETHGSSAIKNKHYYQLQA